MYVPLEEKWIRSCVSNCTHISYPSATHEKQRDFVHVSSNGIPMHCSFSLQERRFPNSNLTDIDRSLKYCSFQDSRTTGCHNCFDTDCCKMKIKFRDITTVLSCLYQQTTFAFIQIVCGWAPLGAVSWQTCGYPGRWNCHLRQLHNLLL